MKTGALASSNKAKIGSAPVPVESDNAAVTQESTTEIPRAPVTAYESLASSSGGEAKAQAFAAERAEMEAVLSSASFAKSPNLGRLLRYVCTQYLNGRTDELKEYSIGAEGLGRGADFDPAANSIVRVEFHRLRERLQTYYETEGVNHAIYISLQPGKYAPQFIRRSPDAETSETVLDSPLPSEHEARAAKPNHAQPELAVIHAAEPAPPSPNNPPTKRRNVVRFAVSAATATLVLAAFIFLWSNNKRQRSQPTAAGKPHPATAAPDAVSFPPSVVRIKAGNLAGSTTDKEGNTWDGDRFFTGGSVSAESNQEINQVIGRTADPARFTSFRYGEFSYDIPVRPGFYELHLGFAELQYGTDTVYGGGEGSRIFHVELNGKLILSHFDVISDAGGNRIADIRVFKGVTPAADGRVHLKFIRVKDDAFVNSIELLATASSRLRPIRIVSQDTYFTDHAGQLWHPDSFFLGGQMALTKYVTQATPDRGLFRGERYGNFSYAIPVAPGKYQLSLWFSETFFRPDNSGKGGAGTRVFDVFCNGHPLLENFDIYREAGANRAVVKTFHGLAASAQGKLQLSFVPVKDYACVNAIEVLEEN